MVRMSLKDIWRAKKSGLKSWKGAQMYGLEVKSEIQPRRPKNPTEKQKV